MFESGGRESLCCARKPPDGGAVGGGSVGTGGDEARLDAHSSTTHLHRTKWEPSICEIMSMEGCVHLSEFKSTKGTNPFRLIYSFFVFCTSKAARLQKVRPVS